MALLLGPAVWTLRWRQEKKKLRTASVALVPPASHPLQQGRWKIVGAAVATSTPAYDQIKVLPAQPARQAFWTFDDMGARRHSRRYLRQSRGIQTGDRFPSTSGGPANCHSCDVRRQGRLDGADAQFGSSSEICEKQMKTLQVCPMAFIIRRSTFHSRNQKKI